MGLRYSDLDDDQKPVVSITDCRRVADLCTMFVLAHGTANRKALSMRQKETIKL